jgi:hypothetical protein
MMPSWVKSRTIVLGTAALLLLVVAVVAFVFAFKGGSNGGGARNPAGAGSSVVLTVDQALAAEEGQTIQVQGALLVTGGRTVLASALSESNPPQATGATLPLKGLNLTALVGLNTTAGQAGVGEATWSNYQLVLKGVITGGVLLVQSTPRVEEDTSVVGLRLRFSPVSEPISSGDQVWWAVDLTNTGQTPIQLVFSDGQQGDVILSQGDTDKYTWSEGKAFTQIVQTVTLEPGKSFPIVLSDTLKVPAGTYDVTARVTAMVGPAGSEAPLPDITSTLTVD